LVEILLLISFCRISEDHLADLGEQLWSTEARVVFYHEVQNVRYVVDFYR